MRTSETDSVGLGDVSARGGAKVHVLLTRPATAWLLLGIGLLATVVAAVSAWQQARYSDEARFIVGTKSLQAMLGQEFQRYEGLLNSVRALWDIHPPVDQAVWRSYIQGLDVPNRFPGLQALAYVERIVSNQLSGFEEEVRQTDSRDGEPANFHVHPRTANSDHFVVRFIEPLESNRQALGYDIGSEPARRQAAERARDTGQASLTRRIALVQAPEVPGLLLLLPVYATGLAVTNLALRQTALIGWVDVAFVVEDLLEAVQSSGRDDVQIQVYDGTEMTPEAQLAGPRDPPGSAEKPGDPAFERVSQLVCGNTVWTLRFLAGPEFAQTRWFSAPGYVSAAGLGLCISLLTFGMARSLASTRRRAQVLANEMTARLRLQHDAMASAKSGIFILDATRGDYPLIYANPAFEQMTGNTLDGSWSQEIVQLLRSDAVHSSPPNLPGVPEAGGAEHAFLRESVRKGQPCWTEYRLFSVLNDQGQRTHYLGIAEDVTEQRRAEEALRESQERFALAVQGTNDGIWDWNVVTGEVYFSPRWKSMLGYEDHEIENTLAGWERLLHPEDRERSLATIQAYFTHQSETYELEHRLRHKNGSYRWILARGVAIRDAQGKPLRMAGSHVDLTARKQAEEELRRAYRELSLSQANLKATVKELRESHQELQQTQLELIQAAKLECIGTLAAGVAHEVKNPLQTMLIGLDYLRTGLPGYPPKVLQAMQDMRDAVKRADAIIGELLQLSADTGLAFAEADLNGVIEKSLRLLHSDLIAGRIEVVRLLEPGLPRVRMDARKMEQVLLNLIINAIQAMGQPGVLRISTQSGRLGTDLPVNGQVATRFQHGAHLVLAKVQDTGPGIAGKDLGRVFDPFFTTKAVGKGTGLGLSIVKKIMDLHEAAVEISNAPEGGAVVTLAFRV